MSFNVKVWKVINIFPIGIREASSHGQHSSTAEAEGAGSRDRGMSYEQYENRGYRMQES